MNNFQDKNDFQTPYALCVRMFRRNPIHAFSDNEEPTHIHTENNWHVISYYDGMCISPITETKFIFDDNICIQCTNECSLQEMAVHCEKKLLYLFSHTTSWKRAWRQNGILEGELGRAHIESQMPCIAIIGIKSWNNTHNVLDEIIESALSEKFFCEQYPGKQFLDDIWYHSFSSIGLNDNYILLYIHDINHIEAVVNAIQMQCAKSGTLIKTYSTLGINKCFNQANSKHLHKRYEFIIRLLTLPGLENEQTIERIKQEFAKKKIPVKIKSTIGSYDIEILTRMSLVEYTHLLKPREGLLGWDNPITLRSNSQIYFGNRHRDYVETRDLQHSSQKKQYCHLVQECHRWLTERHQSYKLLNPSSDMVFKNFGLVYTLACQKSAAPQTWKEFSDVRLFLENYLKLLKSSLSKYSDHRSGINKSLSKMTRELYVLANERLSLEGPSSEKIADSIYEKGAYEKVIGAWSTWLNHLSRLAQQLIGYQDLRPVSFMIIPYMYGQTRSLNHMEFNHSNDAPRAIVIKLSVREMFNTDNLLLTFAHEVGHYCAIARREPRMHSYIKCVCTSSLLGTQYIWRLDGGTSPQPQNTNLDVDEMRWLIFLCKEMINVLHSDLIENIYLDECANQIQNRVREVFRLISTQDSVAKRLRNCFLKYCPALCEDTQTFESYGYRLSKMVNKRSREFASIYREVNADLFMLHSLKPDVLSYLEIIVEQATTYLDFDQLLIQIEQSQKNVLVNDYVDSSWFTLYMRLFCCIMCYYVRDTHDDISTNGRLVTYLHSLAPLICDKHVHPNVSRVLNCLIEQVNKLYKLENGDYLCLQSLNEYARLTLNLFESQKQHAFSHIRDVYNQVKHLSKTSTIAALYHFLTSMKEFETMGDECKSD